jgi:hypothetical protein
MPDSHRRGVKRVGQGHRCSALTISAALTAGVMALPGGTAASAPATLAASAIPSAVPPPPPGREARALEHHPLMSDGDHWRHQTPGAAQP